MANLHFDIHPLEFSKELLPFIEAEQPIQLFCGNRGSTKTSFLQKRAIIFALTKNYFRLVYCRKTSSSLRKSLFQGFKDIIADWELSSYFKVNESEMDIKCLINGNMILAFGLDKPEKLKGVKDPSHVFVDEMTEIDFQDYAALIGLLRTKKTRSQFWGTFNPEYGFWGREYFFLDAASDEIPMGYVPAKESNILLYKATFFNNHFIDTQEYYNRLLELSRGDENKYTVWIEGNWGQSQMGNEYFTAYRKSIHMLDVPFIDNKPVHVTFDFNSVPYMTMLAMQVIVTDTELQVRVFKEYCLASPLNTTLAVCSKFVEDYGERLRDIFYYGDATGNNSIAGKGNHNSFDDVQKGLIRYLTGASKRVLRKNPGILKRRDFMNDVLSGKIKYGNLTVRIMVDNSCKELQKDLLKLKLGMDGKLKSIIKDKTQGIKYQELGHTSDALEYMVLSLLWDIYNKKLF